MTQDEVCAVFSANLKRLMRRDGLKQSDIVTRLNVSKAQVSDWCAGKNLPRSNLLGGLTDIFQCKLSELLGDDKAPGRRAEDLSAEELEIVSILRKMSPEQLARELAYLRQASADGQDKQLSALV